MKGWRREILKLQRFLVTGGAGFIGSAIATRLKAEYPAARVVAADNLRRRGSEFNLARLKAAGVEFRHADVRSVEDLDSDRFDVVLECSAEPSAMAGRHGDARFLLDTNLGGAINCLELARRHQAGIVFISTSRIYPSDGINRLPFATQGQRFVLRDGSALPVGVSGAGVTVDFPLSGRRTLYGASKLAAELIVQEYADVYDVPALILRLGVVAGPWQMGKVDQGFVALWIAAHLAQRPLDYIGFGGLGHQVRDVLHVADAASLVVSALGRLGGSRGEIYNAGGGPENSVSLAELTGLCQGISKRSVPINSVPETRPGDIAWYLSDNAAVTAALGWRPTRSVREVVADTAAWLREHPSLLDMMAGGK